MAVTYGEEVYWRLTGETAPFTDTRIWGFIGAASVYPFAGFFYLPHNSPPRNEMTDADLDEVLNTLAGIVVGAFDEESFLFWWSDRVPFPVAISSQ